MPKVFLKFNRDTPISYVCLHYWLEIFSNYEIFVVCDLFDARDSIPKKLLNITVDKSVKFINTDYNLAKEYTPNFKSKKRKMASANLTCFSYLDKNDKFLWIIDADDTWFLTNDSNGIQGKIKCAEDYLIENSLDGFSLDFYREYNDSWTFGLCLLAANINWQQIKSVSNQEIEEYNLPLNGDSIFDVLGRTTRLKLKSFVFDGYGFQHIENNFPNLAGGIYFWKNKKLWDIPLKEDVIIL
jgi:hypothetical protein